MVIDPRFQEIDDHLSAAMCGQVAGDEQVIIEHIYAIREIAWSINSDVFAKRWSLRPRHSTPKPQRATLDDLLI